MDATLELTGEELTVHEAAAVLRVDPSTVRLWASHGFRDRETGEIVVLRRIKVGRAVRFRREALSEFLAACNR